jgi:SAM-dependent methyltransferase
MRIPLVPVPSSFLQSASTRPHATGRYKLEYWLEDETLHGLAYADYWNDERIEASKPWNILDGNFEKLEKHLGELGLVADLEQCQRVLSGDFGIELRGNGIDLAAGSCWAAPHLLGSGVEQLYCLEYSKHRLVDIAPKVLVRYGVPPEKVVLVRGSFYDLRLPDQLLEFVFLSQAFHHADDPLRLLREAHRVLKPRGCVIIVGEHIVRLAAKYLKNAAKFAISQTCAPALQQKLFGRCFEAGRLCPPLHQLLRPDPTTGDHYYTDREYTRLFAAGGFQMRRIKRRRSPLQSFVLIKN